MTTARIQVVLHWFQQNIFFVGSLFLLLFIPLYPKIPLFDIVPNYQVKVRLEDIFVFAFGLSWFISVLRRKVKIQVSTHYLIFIYLLVGAVSLMFAIVFMRSIPTELLHIGKSGLHLFRYGEYMFLFLLAFAGLSDKKQLDYIVVAVGLVVIVATLYALGQIYWQLPLFSTMNREFSKGQILYYTPGTRAQSTFAGHYDLATFLVISLPLLISSAIHTTNKKMKVYVMVATIAGLWLLYKAAASTAIIAFVFSILIVGYYSFKKYLPSCRKLLFTTAILAIFSLIIGWVAYSSEAYQRLIPFSNSSEIASVHQDQSENTQKYGLSMGIRLDTLWPQALLSFARQPFFGIGFGTLNKTADHQFTEADSTDNNYLRILGETGIIGLFIFLALIFRILQLSSSLVSSPNKTTRSFGIGFIAGTIGLLFNALIIDVFAASKVAFSFWLLAGIATKTAYIATSEQTEKKEDRWFQLFKSTKRQWALWASLLVFIFVAQQSPFSQTSLISNLKASSRSIIPVTQALCWATADNSVACQEISFHTSLLDRVYATYLYPYFLIYQEVGMYYFANLILALATIIMLYYLLFRLFKTQLPIFIALTCALLFSPATTEYSGIAQLIFGAHPMLLPLCLLLAIATFIVYRSPRLPISITAPSHTTILSGFILLTLFFIGKAVYPSTIIRTNFWSPDRHDDIAVARYMDDFIFSEGESYQSSETQPYMLTSINPYFIKLYSQVEFTPLQILGSNMPQIASSYPADTTYESSTDELVSALLQQRSPTYLSNFNAQHSTDFSAEVARLLRTYYVSLNQITCDYDCNFYQLLTEPPQVSRQPATINDLLPKPNTDATSLTLYNHQFKKNPNQTPYITQTLAQRLRRLNLANSDFLLLTGQMTFKNEDSELESLNRGFANHISIPLVYLSSRYEPQDPKSFIATDQIFIHGKTLFVLLDAGPEQILTKNQEEEILTQLLNFEKNPTINSVAVVSDRPFWIQQNPKYQFLSEFSTEKQPTQLSSFYQEHLLPLLSNASKPIYVFSTGLIAPIGPNLFIEQDPDTRITYVASLVSNTPGDTYLQLSFDPNGELTIDAFSDILNQQPQPIPDSFTYGLNHWLSFKN